MSDPLGTSCSDLSPGWHRGQTNRPVPSADVAGASCSDPIAQPDAVIYDSPMASISLQNVTKQFAGQVVLDDVSLDLHTGQIAALVGPNGVGKTTLLRLITGSLAPDTGTVTLSRGLEVGYLPQEPDIAASATLREAVGEAFAELRAMEHKLQALSEQIAGKAALQEAATQTEGRMYTFATADRLSDELPAGRQVPIESLPPLPLWNKWPLLALFLGLLITEWILRKRGGMV